MCPVGSAGGEDEEPATCAKLKAFLPPPSPAEQASIDADLARFAGEEADTSGSLGPYPLPMLSVSGMLVVLWLVDTFYGSKVKKSLYVEKAAARSVC